MESTQKTSTSLFDVYLRLRPPFIPGSERFLEVEEENNNHHTHVTIKPLATDYRKRAVEKFAFTRVFEEDATQRDLLNCTTILPLIEGILGQEGKVGRDGLLATLGVTASGKSHTILGSKSQRGLTQMTLDVLFKSIGSCITHPTKALSELAAVEVSEAHLLLASDFLDSIFGDGDSRMNSRAPTPMPVSDMSMSPPHPGYLNLCKSLLGLSIGTSPFRGKNSQQHKIISSVTGCAKITRNVAKLGYVSMKQSNPSSIYPPLTPRRGPSRPSALPHLPNLDDIQIAVDKSANYSIVISMYEVYNDRIFDLLSGSTASLKAGANGRRRALLFKSTEYSPDRKVVAGLRKVVCGSLDEALLVLETGLMERRVAGTGSNAVSSRSHGFFCVEVKKRSRFGTGSWSSSTLTIVDLAGKPLNAHPIPYRQTQPPEIQSITLTFQCQVPNVPAQPRLQVQRSPKPAK